MRVQQAQKQTHLFSFRHIGTLLLVLFAATMFSTSALAQQTGEVFGKVTSEADGAPIAGVTVEATSSVLPGLRSTVSDDNGVYRLPLLPPGEYTIKFKLTDDSIQTRAAMVNLQKRSTVNLVVVSESDEAYELDVLTVSGSNSLAMDPSAASIAASISSAQLDRVPVGQDYRDIQKLIPGVQYSENNVRGPSAGGSGQDNAYQFDGVDITVPLFGTLGAEPSTQDVDQVSIVRGGAKAIGFNRSGGFTINTTSKSGTDEFHGEVRYQIQPSSFSDDQAANSKEDSEIINEFKEDKAWASANISGPIIKDKLFFYGSYYNPTVDRKNRENSYGPVPPFSSSRDEYFGKLTWAVTNDILLDGSFRTADTTSKSSGVGAASAASISSGHKSTLDIGILEGSWVIDGMSSAYFKYTSYKNKNSSRPDNVLGLDIALGDSLNINDLASQGLLVIPTPRDGEDAYNAFIQPIINQYGFLVNGVPTGGGLVGGGSTFNDQDFERESFEVGYDLFFLTGGLEHDIHAGFKWASDVEDLSRTSNGWGVISVPGGRTTAGDGTPIFYEARFEQMSLGGPGGGVVPPIHSEFETLSIELNDVITMNDWVFNVGVMISQDELFGQGLKKASGTVSGFEVASGHKYLMKKIGFSEMLQPRLGATWNFQDNASLFANYARYYPSASSLARAASWARNLRKSIRARFDENGDFIDIDPVRSSSGKVFQKGIDPRHIDEFIFGGSWNVSDNLTARAHARYRKGRDFWEDTNNTARLRYEPPAGIPQELYVPNLSEIRAEIGGSSYVIAQLDNAHTDYYEINLEAEWQGDKTYLRGSYVWSDYTGNFDQDNSTTSNDANTFIGSSFIADGAGRQLWNFRDGTLRGNRTHMLKLYGYYTLDWDANIGGFFVFQSGEPWEAWDVEVYRHLTGSSSDTSRFAERAGSNTTSSHYQLDLNYTQNFKFGAGDQYVVQFRADLFNVFNKRTGYNIQNKVNSAGFGDPRSFFNPRRLQLAASFIF